MRPTLSPRGKVAVDLVFAGQFPKGELRVALMRGIEGIGAAAAGFCRRSVPQGELRVAYPGAIIGRSRRKPAENGAARPIKSTRATQIPPVRGNLTGRSVPKQRFSSRKVIYFPKGEINKKRPKNFFHPASSFFYYVKKSDGGWFRQFPLRGNWAICKGPPVGDMLFLPPKPARPTAARRRPPGPPDNTRAPRKAQEGAHP